MNERELFEEHYKIPGDVMHCLYSNQYWYIGDGEEQVRKNKELSDKWEAWQARAAKVPDMPNGWSAYRNDCGQIEISDDADNEIGVLVVAKSFSDGSRTSISQRYLYKLIDAMLNKEGA